VTVRRGDDCALVFCLAAMLWIHRSNKRLISHTWTFSSENWSQSIGRKWNGPQKCKTFYSKI